MVSENCSLHGRYKFGLDVATGAGPPISLYFRRSPTSYGVHRRARFGQQRPHDPPPPHHRRRT